MEGLKKDLVQEYYSTLNVGEWGRLAKDPYHRLEYEPIMFITDISCSVLITPAPLL